MFFCDRHLAPTSAPFIAWTAGSDPTGGAPQAGALRFNVTTTHDSCNRPHAERLKGRRIIAALLMSCIGAQSGAVGRVSLDTGERTLPGARVSGARA
jgi:hypothetical protein